MTIGSGGDCDKLETHAFCVFELIARELLCSSGNKTGCKTRIIKRSGSLGEIPTIMEALEFKWNLKWNNGQAAGHHPFNR